MLDHKKLEAEAMQEIRDSVRGTGQDHGNPDLAIAWFLKGARYAEEELRGEIEDYRATLEMYADPFSWRTRTGKIGITPLTDGRDFEVIDGQPTGGKTARRVLRLYERKSDE